MKLIQISRQTIDALAPLTADFRAALLGYRGISAAPDLPAAREELRENLTAGYPIFAAADKGRYLGYAAENRIDCVHPNNDGMIRFLRSRGYTVLNLIEIRKPYPGERLDTTIRVDGNAFDY